MASTFLLDTNISAVGQQLFFRALDAQPSPSHQTTELILFDVISGKAGDTGELSILQRRAAAQKSAGLPPVFNLNVPKEIVSFFSTPHTCSSVVGYYPTPGSPERLSLVQSIGSRSYLPFRICNPVPDIRTHLEEEFKGFTNSNPLRIVI